MDNSRFKFRAWDGHTMFDVAQITLNGATWSVSKGRGVSLEYQPHITLMQYTGLDENSSEKSEDNRAIYEGDIIEFINGERWSVEWNDDTCKFQFSDGSPINDGERYGSHKHILGNIYENPELCPKKD